MNKREAVKQIRNVMIGRSGLRYILIWKKGRQWKTYTGWQFLPEVKNGLRFCHCCNSVTLKEVRELLDKELHQQECEESSGGII